MYVICLDLEGVLVPEIWVAFAEKSGIPERPAAGGEGISRHAARGAAGGDNQRHLYTVCQTADEKAGLACHLLQ